MIMMGREIPLDHSIIIILGLIAVVWKFLEHVGESKKELTKAKYSQRFSPRSMIGG